MPRRGKRINVALTALLTCEQAITLIRTGIECHNIIIYTLQNQNLNWLQIHDNSISNHNIPKFELPLAYFAIVEKLISYVVSKFDHNLKYGFDIQLLMGQILDILSPLNMGHIVISNMFV